MSKVRAIQNFAAFTDDGVIPIKAGQALDSRDPIVKGREHLFESDNDGDDSPRRRGRQSRVEQATAAPGELRDVQ